MQNIIDQALDTLYERVMEMPNKVLDIFNNFFGEDKVDMHFLSKVELISSVLGMPTWDIFWRANMRDKFPAHGLYRDVALADIDFTHLPEECTSALIETILSNSFTGYCKSGRNGYILVHFPRTVVTNEYDKSTVVRHLYVKVPITVTGGENGLFTMNRSEYTIAELHSNYMHSHASHIPKDDFHNFVSCCLGSGPLNNTQTTLSMGFDEDRWNLFCLELSKYVEVESIAGAPYHRLERIGLNSYRVENVDRLYNVNNVYIPMGAGPIKEVIAEFLSYYLDHNNLTFSYRNGIYSLGMPFIEYLIHLSNSFIEYVNSKPELSHVAINNSNIIDSYVIKDGELYRKSNEINSLIEKYREYVGKEICTFKGEPVTVTITDLERIDSSTENNARLINISLASQLLNRILRTINYRYGRNQESPDSTPGKVRYEI